MLHTPLFLRQGKGQGMVGSEHSPVNLFGLTKKSYVPRVARRFNRKNFFRNSCFYVFMTRYFFLDFHFKLFSVLFINMMRL